MGTRTQGSPLFPRLPSCRLGGRGSLGVLPRVTHLLRGDPRARGLEHQRFFPLRAARALLPRPRVGGPAAPGPALSHGLTSPSSPEVVPQAPTRSPVQVDALSVCPPCSDRSPAQPPVTPPPAGTAWTWSGSVAALTRLPPS